MPITTSIATLLLNIIGLKKVVSSSSLDVDAYLQDPNKAKLLTSNGNIHDLLNNVVIEPMLIPTRKTRQSPVYDKMLDTNVDLFGVYYSEAFNSLHKIRGFGLEQTLNLLSSRRYSGTADAVASVIQAVKESEVVLESENKIETKTFLPMHTPDVTLENEKGSLMSIVRKLSLRAKLATNKEANADITIIVAGVVKEVTFAQVLSLLSDKTVKGSLRYWYDEWRSGGTSLWNLIFGTEMIKAYHKEVFKNEKDFEDLVEERVSKANKQLLVDGSVGFSKLYQMLIITSDEAIKLERTTGLFFHNQRDVEKILDTTKSLTITVLDDDAELASIYIAGLRQPIETSYKKLVKKKDDMQISDFARILQTRTI